MAHPLHARRQGAAHARPAPGRRRPRPAHRPAYLQARLAISRPTEPAEREADQVAGRIARSPRPLRRASLAPGAGPQDGERSLLLPKRRPTPRLEELREAQSPRLLPRLYRQPEGQGPQRPEPGPSEPPETEPVTEQTELAPEPASPQAGAGGLALDPEIEQRIEAERGRGAPLPENVRAEMEASFEHDLAAVRIHTDAQAAALARAVDARAFTVGDDIFFAPGEYAPHTEAGRELLAHELTHVVQHRGGIQTRLYRAGDAPTSDDKVYENRRLGRVDDTTKTITIPTLRLPAFKARFSRAPLTLPKRAEDAERDTDQVRKWTEAANTAKDGIEQAITDQARRSRAARVEIGNRKNVYYSKLKRANNYVIGSPARIRSSLLRPYWTRSGSRMFFDVDHKEEIQLGGPDQISNLWLLESRANRSSGSRIATEIRRRTQRLVDAAAPRLWEGRKKDLKKDIRPHYLITFSRISPSLRIRGNPRYRWELEDIRGARPLAGLSFLSANQVKRLGLAGDPSEIVIYTSEAGGGIRKIPWGAGVREKDVRIPFGRNFEITHVSYTKGQGGSLRGQAFRRKRGKLNILEDASLDNFEIREVDWVGFGGYVPAGSVTRAARRALKLRGLSPIEVNQAELDPNRGLVAHGLIRSTLPLLSKVPIAVDILGDEVVINATLSADELDFPRPLEVYRSTLTLGVSSGGRLDVGGEIAFGIERVGQGSIQARRSSRHGLSLAGAFEFDTRLFDPARVRLRYRDGELSGSGVIGIPRNRIRGIRSARIEASFARGEFSATGAAELDIPGVEKGTLSIRRSEEQGFMIGGSFDLSKDIPGIKSGRVSAELTQRPGGESYELKASGEAVPDIPGFDTRLRVAYDNGAITISARAHYRKGLLEGTVTAGATNRTLDEQGQPTGEPGDRLVVFGGGTVTVQLTPWLQGTAGIRFAPNGEVTVSGEIALPSSVELFPRKEIKKNIFSIHIDIPIVGVSVLGHHIGIFATVGGGLDAHAGIGPGTIDQLRLGVTYSPAHEEQTTVSGDGRLRVPADAGLRLFVRGGLGAGIPVVSASAGLEVGGELGLEGAAEAGVHIEWMPGRGLDLRATGRVFVQPRFKFDITGYVDVEADLLLKTVELYSKRWKLKQFEYGSNLRFGIVFPIHYVEGQPFAISLSDVQFETPQIHPRQLLSDLIRRI